MDFLDREFIACLKCSQDCFHWHASNAMARPHIAPSFISLYQQHFDHHLRIPRQFSASFLGKCLGQVKLEGPAGMEWCAELKRENDFMMFSNPGWSSFVEDLNLQSGDGLLFTYLGRSIFKVRIFKLEGVEKASRCHSMISVVNGYPYATSNSKKDQLAKIDMSIPNFTDVGSYDDHKENKISNEYRIKNLDKIHPPAMKCSDKNCQNMSRMRNVEEAYGTSISALNTCSDQALGEADNAERENDKITCAKFEDGDSISIDFGYSEAILISTETQARQCCGYGKASNDQVIKKKIHNQEELQDAPMAEMDRDFATIESIGCNLCDKQTICSKSTTLGRPSAERTNISEMARHHLIREANAFRSSYPIARKSFQPSYDTKMVLPKLFVQMFMPKKVASLTLIDPEGENWSCKWLGGRRVPCMSAGWSQFAHAHELKIDDILVFELIEQQSLRFKVHFFKPQALNVLSRPPFLYSSCELQAFQCHSQLPSPM